MHKSVRQSMAWLHSWLGLSFGWLLFAIFLTGAVTYYRHEITMWMQPQFASMQVNQDTAVKTAYQYLQQHAADTQHWYIGVAHPAAPVNKIYWQTPDGHYEMRTLDASTGRELTLSATQGGDFFYNFHFQLYGLPYTIGRLMVTIAAFIMLITLISGIITHKKILTDFFTLRTFKGQRSYLDFHNVSSVIALPFFLTITFTGLAIFFYIILPSGMKKVYPEHPFQYFEDIQTVNGSAISTAPVKSNMLPVQHFTTTVQQHWGKTEFESITVKQPNTQLAQITFTELKDHSITRNQAQLTFNATTGKLLKNTRNDSAIATLNAGVYGLHMARFADPVLRLALFFSGLLGCAMIASGLLLWSLKRQMQKKSVRFHLGYYLVNRLNISMILGLPLAMLGYLYANRLINIPAGAPNYEIHSFFIIWIGSFMLACLTPQQYLWKTQLKILMGAAFMLPLIDMYYLVSQHDIDSFKSYWPFLRIDLMLWLLALLACFLHQNIHPIQQKAVRKIQTKLKTVQQGSSS